MYIWHPNDSFNKIINKGLISPQFLPVIYQSLISVIIWVNIPRVAATVGGFLQSSLSKLMLAMGWYWKKTKCHETNLGSFFPGSDFHRSSIFNVYTLRRKWQETLLKIGTWIQPRPARSAVDPHHDSLLDAACGAVGAGRLDVELLDKPERLCHEQRHSKGQQGGHEGIQGRLLCLEGDLELGRSGTPAEAGAECILAQGSDYGRWFQWNACALFLFVPLACVFFWPWQVGKYGYSMENGSSLRSSTRSSALRMSSRRASQKTRSNPSERSCRSSSTTSGRTTRRTSPWRPLTMMPCRRRPTRLQRAEWFRFLQLHPELPHKSISKKFAMHGESSYADPSCWN